MKSLIDIRDLSVNEISQLIHVAKDIIARPDYYSHACEGKKLATLFFEPSTRTRLSHEAAMYELGGQVLSVTDSASSSASKGESVADTAKVISCYADIIAIRHPAEGAALVAGENATVPVINAGDGGHSHPTQTLADLLTIHREKGRLDHLVIGLCGDLRYGRTVHSLVSALSKYPGVRFIFVSPEELQIPDYIKNDILNPNQIPFYETSSLEEALPVLDVLYMTRIQKERFDNIEKYEVLKDSYRITYDMINGRYGNTAAPREMCILHPLPRVNEIAADVDKDARACYFKQVENGKYMRMALILKLLYDHDYKCQINDNRKILTSSEILDIRQDIKGLDCAGGVFTNQVHCHNAHCITQTEQDLEQKFIIREGSGIKCLYCESEINQ